MTKRVWANVPAHMPRCRPRLGWTQGSLNARATGRQARALDSQVHPSLPVHRLPVHLACLPAGSLCPANTSALNQQLLSLALRIPSRWARLEPPVPAWRLCASPGAPGAPGWVQACWASFMSSPTECASAGANNVALPSFPVSRPSETLVCKREHDGQGRSGAGPVLLGVGT